MSAACSFDGCTVAETGRCALEKDPNACPNRISGATESSPMGSTINNEMEPSEESGTGTIGAPVLTQPLEVPTFPPSTTLGLETINKMMSSHYVTTVGILGDPNSGKTACLASIYLLISTAHLEGWSFADSRSLMAFEDIARGARRWNDGNPPEQMTVHTEMADERRPGFLHLSLRRAKDGRRFTFALPDIPGEWTKALIRSSNSGRLEFLKSADVIWLVADGRTLNNKELRQGVITRLGQLAGRLRTLFDGAMPRLLLVLTHRDAVEIPADILQRIHLEMAKHDVTIAVFPVAPFSDNEAIKAGFGLAALVDATAENPQHVPTFWPSTQPKPEVRSFLAYRRER